MSNHLNAEQVSQSSGAGLGSAGRYRGATTGEVVPAPLTSVACRGDHGAVSEVIRVVVVDDHASFRSAVAGMVASDARFTVVGDAASGEAVLALAVLVPCDLVVMDVRMPGMGGLVAAAELRRVRPDVVVVLVSSSDLTCEAAAEVGAAFIPKILLTANALAQIWSAHNNANEGGGEHVRHR